MRNAPAVHYPVGRCYFHGWLVLISSCLGFMVITGWCLAADVPPVASWSSAVFLAGLSANAAARWQATRWGELTWTGQSWTYSNLTGTAEKQSLTVLEVRVVLDLQSTMLLCISGSEGAIQWLWTERRQFPARWLAHRRALFMPKRIHRSAKSMSSFDKGFQWAASAAGPFLRKP